MIDRCIAVRTRGHGRKVGRSITKLPAVFRALALAASLTFVTAVGAEQREAQDRLADAFAAIDRALVSSPMPGLVIGLTDRERIRRIAVHGYADVKARTPLTAESRFALGSISKSFTAVALMQLADEGRFDPHAPVTRYLPWFELKSRFAPLTSHDLLSHTSGLPNYLVDASSSRFAVVKLRDFEPAYAPGQHWSYSNTGFQVLGYVLEDIEAARYPAIIQRRVLNALGMAATSAVIDDAERSRMAVSYMPWPYDNSVVEAPWFEYAAGDGSIVSDVVDMCAYARLFLNRGAGPKGRLLSEKAFVTLTTPVLKDYAYGLDVRHGEGGTVIGHRGAIGGFRNSFEAHVDDGFALVFLSNGGIDQELESWVVKAVTAAYHGAPLPPAPTHPATTDASSPQQYAGVYRASTGTNTAVAESVEFVVAGGRLQLKEGPSLRPMQMMGADAFRTLGPEADGFAYYFNRTEAAKGGKIIGVSHGARSYSGRDYAGAPGPVAPGRYATFVGHYENHNFEGPAVRVFVRDGEMMVTMDDAPPGSPQAQALEPLGDDLFRLREPEYSPERLHFDTVIAGHALRLTISGVPFYRVDTP
jgi:D-alanyl-D-alanine carboxypeptidase